MHYSIAAFNHEVQFIWYLNMIDTSTNGYILITITSYGTSELY